jgi:fatty acid desaturase
MRDHRAVIAGPDHALRDSLTAPSDARGLLHPAGHLGLIVLTSLWILHGMLWWLALPVQGVALVFLFTLEHECTHRTPFRTPGLNTWVGRACGLVLILPFEWFRHFHFAHHRFTNLPGQDPELDGPRPQTLRAWAWQSRACPAGRPRRAC